MSRRPTPQMMMSRPTTDFEHDDARIEVHRDGRYVVIKHPASDSEIRMTARQAMAIRLFLKEVHNKIVEIHGVQGVDGDD